MMYIFAYFCLSTLCGPHDMNSSMLRCCDDLNLTLPPYPLAVHDNSGCRQPYASANIIHKFGLAQRFDAVI